MIRNTRLTKQTVRFLRHVIQNALSQIPDEGLERIVSWINAGKPLLLNGGIVTNANQGNFNY